MEGNTAGHRRDDPGHRHVRRDRFTPDFCGKKRPNDQTHRCEPGRGRDEGGQVSPPRRRREAAAGRGEMAGGTARTSESSEGELDADEDADESEAPSED